MKTLTTTTFILLLTATTSHAGSKIDQLCGKGNINEATSTYTIKSNPDGYYISELKMQLNHKDLRVIKAVGDNYHLCTRESATPDMPGDKVRLLEGQRDVRYLFVPNNCPHATSPGA